MNIIQVIRSMTFGGAENHVLTLSKGLRERGHRLCVVCPEHSWIAARCEENQLTVAPVEMRGLFDLRSYWKLHRLICEFHADIVHAHQVRPSQYVGIACLATDAIPVCTAHSTKAVKHMRRCRHIIAVSNAVEDNLLRHHYSASTVTRVYNGVPDCPRAGRDELRRELNIPSEQIAVVCAGRFVRDKGQDILVEAATSSDDSLHIYFIGDDKTPFGQQTRVLADAHPRIHFMGYRSDVQRILPAFDVCCAPSRRESFSLALAEAAAAGLPAVASDIGGIPEVVENGATGMLVPPESPKALKDALDALAQDAALRESMGRAARERYERNFTVEKMVEETEKVYRQLLPGNAD
jgi:glycosyltransferase involved in cell wall biosynthesis